EALGKNVSVNRTTVSSLRRPNGSLAVVQLAGGLNPGNSGGPVTNAKGEVVGVSVAKLRNTDTIAFAIPAEVTDRFVENQIARGGEIRLGELVAVAPPDPIRPPIDVPIGPLPVKPPKFQTWAPLRLPPVAAAPLG